MNFVDVIIIIFLAIGAVLGFKSGVIKRLVDFLGMFIIIILAFYLKNYLSVIMYKNLPFFNFGGFIKGIDTVNILLYEVIAFVIVFAVLYLILRLILMLTGFIEKVFKATIILSIPSKLLGIIVGVVQMYVYIFIILVILTLPLFKITFIKNSKLSNHIVNNTPILSSVSDEILGVYDEVYTIIDERKEKSNENLNEDILKLLINRSIITKENAKELVDKNKIHIINKDILN